MQTGWNPNFSRPVLARIPVKVPTEEQVNRFYMLFYSMVGGFASIVQTQITDTYNLIKENKKIFRFEAKKRITEAKECSDELIDAFMHYMKECGMSQLWMDMTDNIEDDLKLDVQKCFYAIDNQFLKHHVKEHKMYTMLLMSELMSSMLVSSVERFAEMMDKYNGIHVVNIAERFTNPIRGVYARMRNAMEILYPVNVDDEVFSECPDKFNLGFEIIGQKVLDWKRAEKALANACILNGFNLNADGEFLENEQDNTGTPWNETQTRALSVAYPNTSNKKIARILGRSVYEVTKQAKKIGLKKSEEYLRETRIANLKRKKNEKDSKIPDIDISNTFYRKINGKYEPVSMLSYSPLEEGVWVVTRESSAIEHIRGTYLRECFHLDKAADIERFPLSKMGHIKKVAERIIDELRLGNTDTRVMTNHELVNLVVGLVYKYNEEV